MSNESRSLPVTVPSIESSKGMPWYKRWYYTLFATWISFRYGTLSEEEAERILPEPKPRLKEKLLGPKKLTPGEMLLKSLNEHTWRIKYGGGSCSNHVYFYRKSVEISLAFRDRSPGSYIFGLEAGPKNSRSRVPASESEKRKIQNRLLEMIPEENIPSQKNLSQLLEDELFGGDE